MDGLGSPRGEIGLPAAIAKRGPAHPPLPPPPLRITWTTSYFRWMRGLQPIKGGTRAGQHGVEPRETINVGAHNARDGSLGKRRAAATDVGKEFDVNHDGYGDRHPEFDASSEAPLNMRS